MKAFVLTLAALAALLIACGEDKSEADIRDTIEGFFLAINSDPPKAYTYLAQECKDEINFIEFATGLTFFKGFLGESELAVRNFEIIDRQDDAIKAEFDVVLISNGEEISISEELGNEGSTPFVKEEGRWRLANCAGIAPFDDTAALPTPARDARLLAARAVEADSDPLLPGDYVDLPAIYGGPYPDTASHVRREIAYAGDGNSEPPAGGPHWGSSACVSDPAESPPFCGPAPWGIYREPWEPETLVHNMEHAGVVIWYHTDDQEIIDQMESLIAERLNRGQLLVMTPYPAMEAEFIALTAWSRIDKFPVQQYSLERLERFIDVHERRFNPEGF